MIAQKYTRLFLTESQKVETGVRIEEEGQALVFVKEGSETVVKPSTGAAGELFAGIAQTRNCPPGVLQWVGEGVVGNTGAIELPRTPITGQILVKVDGAKAAIGAGAPAAAGDVQLDGNVVTFHADDIGSKYWVQMAYEPSALEARQIVGDAPIGGISAAVQGRVGVITRGEVATTFYDASSDWASALTVKLGPDGRFTTSGQGTTLTNVTVLNAPSSDNSALTLRVNV